MRKYALAACVLLISANSARADDPRVIALIDAFTHACLLTHADPASVRQWAADHKLPEVTNPAGRTIYIGSGDGDAWFFNVTGTRAVVATRSVSSCAIFGESADPAEFLAWYNKILSEFAKNATVTPVKSDDTQDTYGERIGRVTLIQPRVPQAPPETLMLITNQKSGGAYQVTIQFTVLSNIPH